MAEQHSVGRIHQKKVKFAYLEDIHIGTKLQA